MAHTKESLAQEFNLALEDVQETLKALGFHPNKKKFTDEDREHFAAACQLVDEGRVSSLDDLQGYYQGQGSPAPTDSNNGAALRKFATEASQLAYDLGLTQAEIIAQVAPQVASKRLAELIDEGALELDLARQLREWRQGGKPVIDIEALVEERWTQHQLEQYPNPASLPPSSMPSSGNE